MSNNPQAATPRQMQLAQQGQQPPQQPQQRDYWTEYVNNNRYMWNLPPQTSPGGYISQPPRNLDWAIQPDLIQRMMQPGADAIDHPVPTAALMGQYADQFQQQGDMTLLPGRFVQDAQRQVAEMMYAPSQRAADAASAPAQLDGSGDIYTVPTAQAQGLGLDLSKYQTQGDNVLIPAADVYKINLNQQAATTAAYTPATPEDTINGIPKAQWDALAPWQRAALSLTPAGSGAAQGAGSGAIMGLIGGGGIPGAVVGGVMGGGLGAAMGLASENPLLRGALTLLNALDLPAEGIERGIGLVAQVLDAATNPAMYGPVDEVLKNLPAAWQAAHFTENVANFGSLSYDPATGKQTNYAWELTNPKPTETTFEAGANPSSLYLAEARKRLEQGDSIQNIEQDFRKRIGIAYDVREALGHMVLDPLNLLGLGETKLLKWGAKLAKNEPLIKAAQMVEELNRTRPLLNPEGGLAVMGEYARNLRGLKPDDLARFSGFSRLLAGVDANGIPIDYRAQNTGANWWGKAAQSVFGMTAQSKANTTLMHLAQGLDQAIANGTSVEEIEKTLQRVANMTPGQVVSDLDNSPVMHWFESAEAQPTPQAVRAALPEVGKLIEAYKAVQDQPGRPGPVTALRTLAEQLSTPEKTVTINDVVRRLGEAESADDLNRVYRGMIDTLQAKVKAGALDQKVVDDLLRAGYGKVAETARLFYGEAGLPFTLDQLKARVGLELAKGMEKFAVDYFGVKPSGWVERASNAVKSFQTLTMLNTPTFVANNYINNLITLAWDGLVGIESPAARRSWLKSWGTSPEKFQRGATAADLGILSIGEIANPSRKGRAYRMGEIIRNATKGTGALADAERGMANFADRLSLFPRISQKMEQAASEMAYYHAIRPYWDAVWKPGKGFDAMSKEYQQLQRYLDGVAPGTSKRIENMIARSKTREEIERALFNGFQAQGLKDVLTSQDLEVLHAVPGLVDTVDEGLKAAKTPDDVRAVMGRARKGVIDQIRKETWKAARAKTEDLLTKLKVSGVPGGMSAFDQVIDTRTNTLLQHFERMQVVADEIEARGLRGQQRAAYWQKARAEEDAVFRAFEDDEGAKWLGMYRGLGSSDDEANAMLALLGEGSAATGTMGLHSNWRQFFDNAAEEYANFHALPEDMPQAERSKAWDEMNRRLNDSCIQSVMEEDRIMQQLDDLTANLYGRTAAGIDTGRRRDALNWRLSVMEVRRKQAAAMAYLRGGVLPKSMEDWIDPATIERIRGFTRGKPLHLIPFDERAVLNKWFYDEIYRPMITEAGMVGHATQPAAPKPQPAPTTPPRGQAPRQGRVVETPAQPVAAVDQSALWKQVAQDRPEMIGVLPDGTFDPTAKLSVIKYIKKHNPQGRNFRFSEITPEMWAKAVENENLRTQAQIPLAAAPSPTDLRLPENAALRQAFDEFLKLPENLGMTLDEARKRFFVDPKTGAGTFMAFKRDLTQRMKADLNTRVAGFDLRGMHLTNNDYGEAVADAYIRQVKTIADEAGVTVYRLHDSGDEWIVIGADADLTATMQDLSERFSRSILNYNGQQYDGLKFHFGTLDPVGVVDPEGIDNFIEIGRRAINAGQDARNADPAAAVYGREYRLNRLAPAGTAEPAAAAQDLNPGSAEGLPLRQAEPAAGDGVQAAEQRAAAAADPGTQELKLEPEAVAFDTAADADAFRETGDRDLVLVNDKSGAVAIPDTEKPPLVETVKAAPADDANLSPEERLFTRGNYALMPVPVRDAMKEQARAMLAEIQKGFNPPVTQKNERGEIVGRTRAAGPQWYRDWYESSKVRVESVRKALENIILEKPGHALDIQARTLIMGMLTSEEGFDHNAAWWLGRRDAVMERYSNQIEKIVTDPNMSAEAAIRELGPNASEMIDEYLLRKSETDYPNEYYPGDPLPEAAPQDLNESAQRIADNIDGVEARTDQEDRFAYGKQALERGLLDMLPEEGGDILKLLDGLAQNFNPEIDSEAFYNRMGWAFGGEFAGEEGLYQLAPAEQIQRHIQEAQQRLAQSYGEDYPAMVRAYERSGRQGVPENLWTDIEDYLIARRDMKVSQELGHVYDFGDKLTPDRIVYSPENLGDNRQVDYKVYEASKPYSTLSGDTFPGKYYYTVRTPEGIFVSPFFDSVEAARREADARPRPNLFNAQGSAILGLTTFSEEGKALIRIFQADPATVPHEVIHAITPLMQQADADTVRAWLTGEGVTDLPEDWHTQLAYTSDGKQLTAVHRDAYEKLSQAFEQYLKEGEAPTPGLQGVFQRIKEWMLKTYEQIKGGDLNVELSDEMRAMFDRWTSGQERAPAAVETAPTTPPPYQVREGTGVLTKGKFAAFDDQGKMLTNWMPSQEAAQSDASRILADRATAAAEESARQAALREMVNGGQVDETALAPIFGERMMNRATIEAGASWLRAATNNVDVRGKLVDAERFLQERLRGKGRINSNGDRVYDPVDMFNAMREYPDLREKYRQPAAGQIEASRPIETAPEPAAPSLWDAPAGQSSLFGDAAAPWQLRQQQAETQTFNPQGQGQAPLFERPAARGIEPKRVPDFAQQGQMFGETPTLFDQQNAPVESPRLENPAGIGAEAASAAQPGGVQNGQNRTPGLLFNTRESGSVPDAHNLPIGTTEQIVPPPINEATLEMLRGRILPMLDRAETSLADEAGRGNRLFDAQNMDPEQRRQLRAYLGKVGAQMGDAKLAALRYGEAKRDFALLPYQKRYGFDTGLMAVMPYEFWYTRSMVNWALRAIDKPQIAANFLRMQQLFNEQQKRNGFPTRLRKKSFIQLPFLPDWMGEGIYVDPYKQAFPFLQLTGPFEKLYDQENQANKRAETLLLQAAQDGEIDAAEAQKAIQSKSGLAWQDALAQAKNEQDADIQNPLDFARMMSGLSLPLNIAYLYATGRQDEIGQLPLTRMVQNLTAAAGIGGNRGFNLEGGVRKMAGLPEVDRFEDYRTDRMLAGMAADGVITAEAARLAMIDRKGPAFDLAQRQVSQMGVWQYLGAPLSADFFPEGEQTQRALKTEYDRAYTAWKDGDKKALTAFFDAHPEYQARLDSFKDPQARLKNFLVSEVWNRYNDLPSVHKKQVQEQLGQQFQDSFLNKATRSYDSISDTTLTSWAKAISIQPLPEKSPDAAAISLKLAPAETAQAVESYRAEGERRFPGLSKFLTSFYQETPEMQNLARKNMPQIQAYYSWKNKYLAEHPQIIPWVTSQQNELYGLPQQIQTDVYKYRAQKEDLYPGIDATQNQYFNIQEKAGRSAYLRQHPELSEYWDWKKAEAASNTKIAPYIMSDQALANAIEYNQAPRLSQAVLAQMSSNLKSQLLAYFYAKEQIRAGAYQELEDLWNQEGQPYGSLKSWMTNAIKPSLTGN